MTRQDSREGPVPLKDGANGAAIMYKGTAKHLQDLTIRDQGQVHFTFYRY